MLNPLKIAANREDLFVWRYERLLRWALQLTESDRELAEDAHATWCAIIVEHVRAFADETTDLHCEIGPGFPSQFSATQMNPDADIASDADLIRAVRQLMQLASANDDAVKRSFSISANSGNVAPVKTVQFWRSLAAAESLAA